MDYILAPATLLAGAIWWTNFRNGLDPVTLFPTLALFALFEDPANTILKCWPQLGEIAACNERLQSFLLLEEREDSRKIHHRHDESDTPSKEADVSTVEHSIQDDNAAESEKKSFGETVLRLSNASIAPEPKSSNAVLHNLNLSVERGALTIVTGAVGCGKSTLLRGLLGEAPLRQGSIEIEKDLWPTVIKKSGCPMSPFSRRLWVKVASTANGMRRLSRLSCWTWTLSNFRRRTKVVLETMDLS